MPITLQQTRPPLRVAFDLETIAAENAIVEAEAVKEFEILRAELETLRKEAVCAQSDLKTYLENTQKPLKKDTEPLEKMVAKYEKAKDELDKDVAKFVADAAFRNSARIICLAFVADKKAFVFTWLPVSQEGLLDLFNAGIQVSVSDSEANMLATCMAWLDTLPIEIMAGHNAYGFDMPKVRGRCARLKVHKAVVFQPHTETQIVDTMREFVKYYGMGQKQYISLDAMCEAFGLSGKPGKGSEVAALYAAGEHVTIIKYCVLDAVLVDQALDAMEIYPTGGGTL